MVNVRVQEIRESKGMSKSELARRSKLALSYINSIESGEKSPTVRTLEKIAAALEVSISDLIQKTA